MKLIRLSALKLVSIRAEAMQLATEIHKGAMATVLYGPDSKLSYACKRAKDWALERGVELPTCQIGNYLFPHCKVVSGSEEVQLLTKKYIYFNVALFKAISFLESNMKEFNLKKIMRRNVSGAFHSDLMGESVRPFQKALEKSEVSDPVISVYSNVDGKRYRNADHIRRMLPKQVVAKSDANRSFFDVLIRLFRLSSR